MVPIGSLSPARDKASTPSVALDVAPGPEIPAPASAKQEKAEETPLLD